MLLFSMTLIVKAGTSLVQLFYEYSLYIFAQLHLHVLLGHQPQIPVTATIQNATSTKILIPSSLQQKLRNLEGRYCPTGLVTDITLKPKPIVAFGNGAMGDVILIPWIKNTSSRKR